MYYLRNVIVAMGMVALCSCGGGGDGAEVTVDNLPGKQTTYAISGAVTGLGTASLTLSNRNASSNTAETLTVLGTGANEVRFTFATALPAQTDFTVSVIAPFPANLGCSIVNASGRINSAAVGNIQVNCTPNTYTVSGVVNNLSGSGLQIRNNGGDTLTVQPGSPAAFTFPTALSNSVNYAVTVFQNPTAPSQTCVPGANASGSSSGGNITTVVINCNTNTYTVGGTITGLTGSGLQLRNNGGDTLSIAAGSATFTFNTPIASGATFNVTTAGAITSPLQICAVSPTTGSGTVGSANVTNVAVTCTTTTFAVGGTISGLAGVGLRLRNNGGDELQIGGNGAFAFQTQVASGGSYNVSVSVQPVSPQQVCLVTAASGAVVASAINSVSINCLSKFGRFAYVTDTSAGAASSLWLLAINPLNGALTSVAGPAVTTGQQIRDVLTHPNGRYLYSKDSGGWYRANAFSIDQSTGQLAFLNQSTVSYLDSGLPDQNIASWIQVDATGENLYVSGVTVAPNPASPPQISGFVDRFAISAGQLSFAQRGLGGGGGSPPLSWLTPGGSVAAFSSLRATHPNGLYFYSVDSAAGTITQYNITSGTLSLSAFPPVATGSSPIALVIDPAGRNAYTLSVNDASVTQFAIDPISGALTSLSPATISVCSQAAGMAFEGSGRFAYVTCASNSSIQQFSVDGAGALSFVSAVSTMPTGTPGLIAIAGPN